MKTSGIILCGGKSSRMGRAKAWLPFGDEFLLQRVVRAVREATGRVVVVAAQGQDVPPLPDGVELVRDEIEGRGPLSGLAAGLAALEGGGCDAAYLSACDAPFLTPEFVRCVIAALGGPPPAPALPSLKERGEKGASETAREFDSQGVASELSLPSGRGLGSGLSSSPLPFREGGPGGVGRPGAAVPRAGERLHPLAAAYRADVLAIAREMLAAGRFRMTDLFTLVPTRVIGPEELRSADAELRSLRNLNTPDEYAAARHELGIVEWPFAPDL